MKHIDSRILWLQNLIAAGGVRLKKIRRTHRRSTAAHAEKSGHARDRQP